MGKKMVGKDEWGITKFLLFEFSFCFLVEEIIVHLKAYKEPFYELCPPPQSSFRTTVSCLPSSSIPVVELFHLGPWSLVAIFNCHSTDGLISHLPSVLGFFFLNLNNVRHSRPTGPAGSPSNYQKLLIMQPERVCMGLRRGVDATSCGWKFDDWEPGALFSPPPMNMIWILCTHVQQKKTAKRLALS